MTLNYQTFRALAEALRRLGDNARAVELEAKAAVILESVARNVTERRGAAPDGVVITYPAGQSRYRYEQLQKAARKARLPNAAVIPEGDDDNVGRLVLTSGDFTLDASYAHSLARTPLSSFSHGLLTELAVENLAESPSERLFITDTVETQPVVLPEKVEVISVAALFGEAIRRIHRRESISILFD